MCSSISLQSTVLDAYLPPPLILFILIHHFSFSFLFLTLFFSIIFALFVSLTSISDRIAHDCHRDLSQSKAEASIQSLPLYDWQPVREFDPDPERAIEENMRRTWAGDSVEPVLMSFLLGPQIALLYPERCHSQTTFSFQCAFTSEGIPSELLQMPALFGCQLISLPRDISKLDYQLSIKSCLHLNLDI